MRFRNVYFIACLLLTFLISLCSCTPDVDEAFLYEFETKLVDGEVEFDPLSDEMVRTIEKDYRKFQRKNGGYDVNYYISQYYGCYNGAIPVMMEGEGLDGTCDIKVNEIAGSLFYFSSGSDSIEVWYGGTFYSMKEAYEKGILNDREIAMINQVHGGRWLEKSPELTAATEALLLLDQSQRKEIREAFGWSADEKWWYSLGLPTYLSFEAIRCYGKFNDVYLLMEPTSSGTSEIKRIGGSSFKYAHSFSLWAYTDGRVLPLEEAINKRLLTQDDVAAAAANHQAVEQFLEVVDEPIY